MVCLKSWRHQKQHTQEVCRPLWSRFLNHSNAEASARNASSGTAITTGNWSKCAYHGGGLALLGGGDGDADGAAVDDVARHLSQRAIPLRLIAEAHESVSLRTPCQGVCDHLHSATQQVSAACIQWHADDSFPQWEPEGNSNWKWSTDPATQRAGRMREFSVN